MSKMKLGRIFDIKEFAVYDGEGIRVTYFLQGCPLRCEWCHNPEGQSFSEGWSISSKELIEDIKKYEEIWKICGGGVTFSGGEPMCQSEFLLNVIAGLQGISITIETSAAVMPEIFQKIALKVDFLYVDLKVFDEEIHRRYTGKSNRQIKENIKWLAGTDIPFVIRIPMIPGVSDTENNYKKTAEFIAGLKIDAKVELLPYNTMTKAKYDAIKREYMISFDPEKRLNQNLKEFIDKGISCRIL